MILCVSAHPTQRWADLGLKVPGAEQKQDRQGSLSTLGNFSKHWDAERLVAVARTGQVGVGSFGRTGVSSRWVPTPAGPRLPAICSDWVFEVFVVDAFRRYVSVSDHVPKADLKRVLVLVSYRGKWPGQRKTLSKDTGSGAVQPPSAPRAGSAL